jgi:hypothetical protein
VCEEIDQLRADSYEFLPNALTKEERVQRTRDVERFWTVVRSYGSAGVACLRLSLGAECCDSFFLLDGTKLLLNLDETGASLECASKALARVDLDKVPMIEYASLLLRLSARKVDIGSLAAKVINRPEALICLDAHAIRIDRVGMTLLLYGSMPDEQATQYLATLAESERRDVRIAGGVGLAANMSAEAFKALNRLRQSDGISEAAPAICTFNGNLTVEGPPAPDSSRETVVRYLESVPNFDSAFAGFASSRDLVNTAVSSLTEADIETVRRARRRSIRLSDEAYDEYLALSSVLRGLIERLDLYREDRRPFEQWLASRAGASECGTAIGRGEEVRAR